MLIKMIEKDDSGDYVLFPDRDEKGNIVNFKGTSANLEQWNIEKYMMGKHDEGWYAANLDESKMADVALYCMLAGMSGN